jgi:cytochrome c553
VSSLYEINCKLSSGSATPDARTSATVGRLEARSVPSICTEPAELLGWEEPDVGDARASVVPLLAAAGGLADSLAAPDTSSALRAVVCVLCHHRAARPSRPTAKMLMTIHTQGGAWLRGAAGGRWARPGVLSRRRSLSDFRSASRMKDISASLS